MRLECWAGLRLWHSWGLTGLGTPSVTCYQGTCHDQICILETKRGNGRARTGWEDSTRLLWPSGQEKRVASGWQC